MNLFTLGLTLDTIGKILLGFTVLMVHWHVVKEHKIDEDVFRIMKIERILGMLGILLIVIGYIFQFLYHA